MNQGIVILIGCLLSSPLLFAQKIEVEMKTVDNATPIGTIIFEDTPYGLLISPKLKSMRPGLHGFHLHEKPSCLEQGKAAGGHYDPAQTNQHLGPYAGGHLGDLPVLYADQSGSTTQSTLAPRLCTEDIQGHSVLIEQEMDSYFDKKQRDEEELVACGLISKQGKAGNFLNFH